MTKWEPTLEFEESMDDVDNARLNKKHELKYKMEYDQCLKRKIHANKISIRPMPNYGNDAQRL